MTEASEPTFTGAGGALWAALTSRYDLDERERMILALAVGQANQLADLEARIADAEPVVRGSKGQDRLNPLIAEARLARLALGRLLGQIDLPSSASQPGLESASSQRARHAAATRWRRERERQAALEVVRQRDAG